MRQIVGAITGLFLSLYFMYFFFPLVVTERTQLSSAINATDPTIVTSTNLGNGIYLALPLIPVLVLVFILINYALKRDSGE